MSSVSPFLWCALIALVLPFVGCDKETETKDLPTLSIADVSVLEGNANNSVSLLISLSAVSENNVVLSFSTKDLSAASGIDYVAVANTQATIQAGQTSVTIAVTVKGDDIIEPTEAFEVVLLNPINATLSKGKATVTLQNDDADQLDYIPTTGFVTPLSYTGMDLVWQDEFDGTTLDAASWTHEIGNGTNGWGNNELMYYRAENTSMEQGNLVITAKKETFGGFGYTSSRLVTRDKKSFQYGRIDIRAALPKGQGMWPALWMLGDNIGAEGWPKCGEIDIMELVGHQPNRVHATVHYGDPNNNHLFETISKALTGTQTFGDEYHVFSLVWVEDQMQFLLDNVVYQTITPATIAPSEYPFNAPFFFIFNVAVGGNWPGAPDATTNFPQRMVVDYVRVFQ